MSAPDGDPLTVYFDGACPLCTAEIAHYKRRSRDGSLMLVDVSAPGFCGDERLSKSQAQARFHIRKIDGEQLSGARAFVALWRRTPGWRWLARCAQLPGMTPVMERLYRFFLRRRPALVRVFVWLTRKGQNT